ncbi:MAG: NADP oxidoreductase [Candidatus Bathyarchaeota archaeon]|nr:NADP oxidoreductase [Candidatus Bathyarchaeota archaeon]
MNKVKVSTLWLSGCSGCHMSLLDIDEKLVNLLEKIEIVKSPIIDVKEYPNADVGIVEGAISTEEDIEQVKKLRDNCKILVAIGDCSCFGGITSYRNLFDKEDLLSRVFIEAESNYEGKVPKSRYIPPFLEKAKAISNVVNVDCYVPGCPPDSNTILYVFSELLKGKIPILPSEMASFE